jgi:hypothetical protein
MCHAAIDELNYSDLYDSSAHSAKMTGTVSAAFGAPAAHRDGRHLHVAPSEPPAKNQKGLRMRRGWLRWTPVAFLALLAGCSGADPNRPTGTTQVQPSVVNTIPDTRCTEFITDAEMQKATGLKDIALVASSGQPAAGEQYCPFRSESTETNVLLGVFTGAGLDNTFTAMDRTADTQNPQAITGVGDQAKWTKDTSTLLMRTGATGVSIMLQNPKGIKDIKKASTSIAKIVQTRV